MPRIKKGVRFVNFKLKSRLREALTSLPILSISPGIQAVPAGKKTNVGLTKTACI